MHWLVISQRCAPVCLCRRAAHARLVPHLHQATEGHMMNECAQIVLRVQPMSTEDCRTTVIEAISRLEGVKTVNVDLTSGVVRVDGAVGDRELVAAVESVGRRALVVTHTRGVGQSSGPARAAGQSSSSSWLKLQLFMKLMRRQVDCCGD